MDKKKEVIIGILIIVLMIFIGAISAWYYKYSKIETVITIDANPNIIMNLNYKGEVVKIDGLNFSGKEKINNIRIIGKKLDNVIFDVCNIIFEKGYINNSEVNITIQNSNNEIINVLKEAFDNKKIDYNIIINSRN